MLYAFWSRAWVKEAWYNDIDQVKAVVFRFDHILGRLKASRDGVVAGDEVGCSELSIFMDRDLGLEYVGQVWLINKAEVWDRRVIICRSIRSTNVVRKQHI